MTARSNDERFQNGAQDYAAYLETPEGRLRSDLVFANLQDFLPPPQADKPMHALDVACGTGATAVRLAQLGYCVTQLDWSPAMLDIARRTVEEAGLADRVTFQLGDAGQLTKLYGTASFDVVLCHNILEYVDDPTAVLQGAARVLRGRSAILSIVVRNQAGEVLKAAIQSGNLAAAEANLTAEWGIESLYGGEVRLFTATRMRSMLNSVSLELVAARGVRVLSDYLPPGISRAADYARILEFERRLGCRLEFARIARYSHYLTRSVEPGAPSRAGFVLDGAEENGA